MPRWRVLALDGPAADKAYRAVLDSIAAGIGARRVVAHRGPVAETTGMSRTPVREAFLRLSTEGLLELYPKRGAIVTAPSAAEVDELLEVRAMFEKSAVAWMAAGGVPDGLEATLRGHLDAQAGAADALEFARSDRALHEAIVAAGGNSIATPSSPRPARACSATGTARRAGRVPRPHGRRARRAGRPGARRRRARLRRELDRTSTGARPRAPP